MSRDVSMSDSRRKFLTFATGALAGIGTTLASIPFFRSLSIPKHKQSPYVDIEFTKLKEGQLTQGVLMGKPIFVARRTPEQIDELNMENPKLRDPESLESEQPDFAQNAYRSQNPDVFVAVGLCTHLGCSPGHIGTNVEHDHWLPDGGYFCPCHGAVFDAAGRVVKGVPAPRNLEIPQHQFIEEGIVRVWHG